MPTEIEIVYVKATQYIHMITTEMIRIRDRVKVHLNNKYPVMVKQYQEEIQKTVDFYSVSEYVALTKLIAESSGDQYSKITASCLIAAYVEECETNKS